MKRELERTQIKLRSVTGQNARQRETIRIFKDAWERGVSSVFDTEFEFESHAEREERLIRELMQEAENRCKDRLENIHQAISSLQPTPTNHNQSGKGRYRRI